MQRFWRLVNKSTGESVQHTLLQTARWMYEGAVPRMNQVYGWAGLQGESGLARPTARGRRCSHNCYISQACPTSAGPQGTEAAKWLKEDTPAGWSGLRRHSHSRGRDRLRWHQSPLPQCPSQHQSPSPSPPMIPFCQWEAQLLHEKPQLTTMTPQIQEQGVVRWHQHTSWGETEETSQVWCGRGTG